MEEHSVKKFNSIILSVALGTTVVFTGLSTQAASAISTDGQTGAVSCDVKGNAYLKGAGGSDHRFTINSDGTITARFDVIGDNCKAEVTLATYTAPNATDGKPYSAQKAYSHTTAMFKPGKGRTITTKLPNCYYQADLMVGHEWSGFPTTPFPAGTLRTSLHGGTQSCTPVTPPVLPPTTPPAELPHTGAGVGTLLVTVGGSVIAATLGYRRYLSRRTV
jgi:hypothetical protein